jgi:hypothetical protein
MEESIMVMEKSRSHLKALSELAPQLNQATDRYMDELREIEAELKKLNLGIEVELDKPILEGNRFEEEKDFNEPTGVFYHSAWLLGYGKYGDREWCLLVRQYTLYSDDRGWCQENSSSLLGASRELRIAAADYIPLLLEKIGEEVKAKIAVLKKVSDKK